jgi:hypothetical protein
VSETPLPELVPDVTEALAAVGIDSLGLALAPFAKEFLPLGAKQVTAMLVFAYKRKKAKAFWTNVMTKGETTEEFAEWINARLADDPDRVTASFAEGARAAAERADLAAIPSIGLLLRRYVAGEFPKWFFRGALDLLVSVDAVQVGVLRDLLRQMAAISSDDGHLTVTNANGPAEIMAGQERTPLAFHGGPHNQLSRYMRLLKQSGLAHESGGYGLGGSHNAMVIETDTICWLRAIIPPIVDVSIDQK